MIRSRRKQDRQVSGCLSSTNRTPHITGLMYACPRASRTVHNAGYVRVPPAVFSRFRNVKATDNVVVVAAIDTAFVMISSRLAIDMPYAK